MKDQPSAYGDKREPVRPKTIPDDFIWDPETEAWYAPGTPSMFDAAASLREFNNLIKEERRGGLISVDKLRAAGALDVPPSWRKALGGGPNRQLDLFGDEDTVSSEEEAVDDDDTE